MKPEEHPFYSGHGFYRDVDSRMYVIKRASIPELRAILSPDGQAMEVLQKCVRLAAEARLRRLEKEEVES